MTAEATGPAVSVVIGAYNAERWIAETIASVLGQTWRDFELIVVDDGSTDATAEIVKHCGAPVRYLHQENKGQPAARNTGIRAAQGRYVAFVDADDLWHPEKLARQMRLFEEDPLLAWCYTDAFLFASETGAIRGRAGQENALHEGDVLRPLLLGNFILSPTPVVRREVFDAVGSFNEDPVVRNGEDWEMWLRIAERYPVRVLRRPLAKVRLHDQRMSASVDLEYALSSRLRIVRAALRRHPAAARSVGCRAVANVHAALGRWALGAGRWALGAGRWSGRSVQRRGGSWVRHSVWPRRAGSRGPISSHRGCRAPCCACGRRCARRFPTDVEEGNRIA